MTPVDTGTAQADKANTRSVSLAWKLLGGLGVVVVLFGVLIAWIYEPGIPPIEGQPYGTSAGRLLESTATSVTGTSPRVVSGDHQPCSLPEGEGLVRTAEVPVDVAGVATPLADVAAYWRGADSPLAVTDVVESESSVSAVAGSFQLSALLDGSEMTLTAVGPCLPDDALEPS